MAWNHQQAILSSALVTLSRGETAMARRPQMAKSLADQYIKKAKRPSWQKIYHTARWRKTRELFLQDHPFCEECHRNGDITLANVVDHKIPHRGNERLAWDVNNFAALCQSCHSTKTASKDGGFGNFSARDK